jgi:hypothetical protein
MALPRATRHKCPTKPAAADYATFCETWLKARASRMISPTSSAGGRDLLGFWHGKCEMEDGPSGQMGARPKAPAICFND